MRTITLVTQKGGAGKTTLAASLAVAAAQAGETVVALDLDPQGSLASWGDTRTVERPAIDRVGTEKLPQLPAILTALGKRGFTLAILDTAGTESTGGNLAMRAADLALIPARPSRLDLQATMPRDARAPRHAGPLRARGHGVRALGQGCRGNPRAVVLDRPKNEEEEMTKRPRRP